MKRPIAMAFAITLIAATQAGADQLTIREFRSVPLSRPNLTVPRSSATSDAISGVRKQETSTSEPDPYLLFPVAGVIDQDLYIAYYVDLDSGPGVLAFNCSKLSYDGNTGDDPYIRGFREEDIGVPVFAAIGGTVAGVHNGEPDHNTDMNPARIANHVAILHGTNQVADYVHLRKDTLVQVGDVVTAGTQIGWVGSSGQSSGPHVHFESQLAGVPYEAMAGPCRAGRSNFSVQPNVSMNPFVAGVALSSNTFDNPPLPPDDSIITTGTFIKGSQNVYLRIDIANVSSATDYTLQLTSPAGTVSSATGIFSQYQQEFLAASFWLTMQLDTTGTWTLKLSVGGTKTEIPFRVVNASTEIVNHPPNPLSASIDPISAGGVAVCRANSVLLADPDYDVVAYSYVWTANGSIVRTVTSAARADALPQQYANAHNQLTCTVSAFDGLAQTPPSQAFAEVSPAPARRHAAGH